MNSKTWHYQNARVGVGNGNGSGVLSKQGVATNGRNLELQMHQSKTNQVAGTEKVLAQYPDNQQIGNGWASGIQEPRDKKGNAGVGIVKES
jgi:hypothetical protein